MKFTAADLLLRGSARDQPASTPSAGGWLVNTRARGRGGSSRLPSSSSQPPSAAESVDEELVRRASEGDAEAWAALVDRYKRLVYSIPRRYQLSDDLCEDVFQNTFVLLLRELRRLREPAGLTKWLMTTTHRECWRAARKARAQRTAGDLLTQTYAAPAEDTLLRWERQERLHTALQTLGGRCEALLRAMYLDPARASYSEIGARLGISVGSVGPTRARCMQKLLELVADLR